MGTVEKDPDDARFEALFDAFHKAVEEGDVEAEERLGVEALALAGEWAEKNMSEDLQLKMLASSLEDEGNWPAALVARRRVLRIAEGDQSLARDSMVFKAHDELRAHHQLLGRTEVALMHARAAVDAARRAEMKILLGMALQPLIAAELAAKNESAALEAASEMVTLSEGDRQLELIRAQALIARAGCLIRSGDLEGAERDLNAASPLLTPKAGAAMLAGAQATLAGWWETAAAWETESQNFDAAVEAFAGAIAFRRNVAKAPQLSGPYARSRLARSLDNYAVALERADRQADADLVRIEAATLREPLKLPGQVGQTRT